MKNDLSIKIGNFSYKKKTVLSFFEYSFSIPGLYILKGKNGSGKTTFLNIISGQLSNKSVELKYYGELIDSKKSCSYFDEAVTYVPQDPIYFPALTCLENITADKQEQERALLLLKDLGLLEVCDTKAELLSSGQKQRLSFAMAIFNPKQIILIDEIGANLDSESLERIHKVILELKKAHLVLYVTHLNEFEDEATTLIFDKGKIQVVEKIQSATDIGAVPLRRKIKLFSMFNFDRLSLFLSLCLSFIFSFLSLAFSSFGFSVDNEHSRVSDLAFENLANRTEVLQPAFNQSVDDFPANEVYYYKGSILRVGHSGKLGDYLTGIVERDVFTELNLVDIGNFKSKYPENEDEIIVSDLCAEALFKENKITSSHNLKNCLEYNSFKVVGFYMTQKEDQLFDDAFLDSLNAEIEKNENTAYLLALRKLYTFPYEIAYTISTTQSNLNFYLANTPENYNYLLENHCYYLNDIQVQVILSDAKLEYIYKDFNQSFCNQLSTIFLIFYALSAPLAVILLCVRNRKKALLERMRGRNRANIVYPLFFALSLFSLSGYLSGTLTGLIVLLIMNIVTSSSPHLLFKNYFAQSNLNLLLTSSTTVISLIIVFAFIYFYLCPAKFKHQLIELKRR